MHGFELARRAKAIRTDLKVVYVTGQPDPTLERDGGDARADRAQAVWRAPIGDVPASGFGMTAVHSLPRIGGVRGG